jgi:hypothetical protein
MKLAGRRQPCYRVLGARRKLRIVSRTAWDASRAHDANYLTFHRLPDFRIHKTEDDQ